MNRKKAVIPTQVVDGRTIICILCGSRIEIIKGNGRSKWQHCTICFFARFKIYWKGNGRKGRIKKISWRILSQLAT